MTITRLPQNEINSFQLNLLVCIHVSYNTEILGGCRKQARAYRNCLRFYNRQFHSSMFFRGFYFLQPIAVCRNKLMTSCHLFRDVSYRNHSMYEGFEVLTALNMETLSTGDIA
jgi:hypothetical protein